MKGNIDSYKCLHATGRERTRFNEVPNYQEGLYQLENQCYAWMVPNGSWGESNAGLIVGNGESLLVDTLWDAKYTKEMLQSMESLVQEAPLKYVVNTHADGDHYWGNELVKDLDIITTQASLEEMVAVKPKSMVLFGRLGKWMSMLKVFGNAQAGHWFQQMVKPYDFHLVQQTPAKRSFQGELDLDVGGRKVRLIEVGPAHTQGDLIVHVPDARLVYTADILFIGSTPVMWAGPIENWFKALDTIQALDAETIVPGHGPITDHDGVEWVRSYWKFVQEKVEACFKEGMSAPQAAHAIVLSDDFAQSPFANWNSPERMMTNAHTLYRHLQGRKDHPKVPELIGIMRKQALLAHKLPNAQPASIRKK